MDLLQSAKLENETFWNPYYRYISIASTIAYMVLLMFDLIHLGSSVIRSFSRYPEIGFYLGSSVIDYIQSTSRKTILLRFLPTDVYLDEI